MTGYRKAFRLLTRRERRRGVLVLGVVLIVALFEALAVVSVVPFMSALGNRDMVETNRYMKFVYDWMGFASANDFLLFLGIASFALLVTAAVVRILGKYHVTVFAQMLRSSIETRLLENYLRQPYEFHLNRHSGDLAKSILSEVDQVINNVFQPIANMLAQVFTLLILVVVLLIYNPVVALTAVVVLGGAYWVIYAIIRQYIDRIGAARAKANRARFETTVEAIGGVKDIRLLGREQAYLDRFRAPSRKMSRYLAMDQVLGQVPKFLIEAIAFGSILLMSLALMAGAREGEGLGTVLPTLGLYAFAGYRILPAIQQIYRSLTQMRFGAPAVTTIHDDLRNTRDLVDIPQGPVAPLPLKDRLCLDAVSYGYPGAATAGVSDITLEIAAGTTLGIVGSTGAGKTTLVDLILGLLTPSAGHIAVDGTRLTAENLRNWQANIGYVPQDIFLVDASISANIALGIAPDLIDAARVRQCARLAQVDSFIEGELPDQYQTRVGERGVRLSGGQKQRIGIARALYHDPEVIVFDEATSALDNLTERDVMKAVGALHGTKTIIMIAHRLSTVKICDRIVVLEKGRQTGLGSYAELSKGNAGFQRMLAG
ncbi:MAG: ABC transporter ATP-binding protein [Alphaproteobacteria bacterium HGW-Alphaproteobacteria-6]|nr:MAG: ABC transporter ATP-binding protein [Alphaproteobacteria bacterium HGW-Alphaproteobacteria-6]